MDMAIRPVPKDDLAQMMHYIENQLRQQGNRILIVETSGRPEFAMTRTFYVTCGYIQQAILPEFHKAGDDQVIFWKG